MGGIFISYRRGDTNPWAGRLSDSLKTILGRMSVFRDIEDIPPGVEFDHYIAEQVGACDVLIALIGPHWLSAQDELGRRRLDDQKDYLRLEIAAALTRNIPVVPVLVGDAAVPPEDRLPEPLKPLSRRQAFTLNDTYWAADCQRLANFLRRYSPYARSQRNTKRLIAAAVVVLVLVAMGAGVMRFRTRVTHNPGEGPSSLKSVNSPPGEAERVSGTESLKTPDTPRLLGAWPNGSVLNVAFLNGSLAQKQKVEEVAPEWSHYANLKFQFVEGDKGDVRIRFSSGIAPWSFRGIEARDIPPQCPTMTLVAIADDNSVSSYDRAAILHEFGHVLGFLDEIQNPNGHIPWRPEVRAQSPDYVYTQQVSECRAPLNHPVTYQAQLENYRAFDPHSIMMAYITSQFLTEDTTLGGASDLSASDKAFARKMYPR
jgi:hypothetical protein